MRKVNRDTRGDHQKATNSQGSKESRHPTPNRRSETQFPGLGRGGDLAWPQQTGRWDRGGRHL